MEKFSYGLEFYYNEIFSLEDEKLFKRKVKEAKKVDEYFSSFGLNIDYIRPYILYAYKLNKNLGIKNTIRYVKGLIYATDYVDFDDVENIISDYNLIENIVSDESDNDSLWSYTGFLSSSNTEAFENNSEDDLIDTSNNSFELDNKTFENIAKSINKEEENEEEIEDIPIEYISVLEKLDLFKRKAKIYIKTTIEYKLNENKIDTSDIPMVKKGMKDWFNIIFSSMEDLIKINDMTLKYNDKNVIKYL